MLFALSWTLWLLWSSSLSLGCMHSFLLLLSTHFSTCSWQLWQTAISNTLLLFNLMTFDHFNNLSWDSFTLMVWHSSPPHAPNIHVLRTWASVLITILECESGTRSLRFLHSFLEVHVQCWNTRVPTCEGQTRWSASMPRACQQTKQPEVMERERERERERPWPSAFSSL